MKEARMPDEKSADVLKLGEYASESLKRFYDKTGRKLRMEIEPGTILVANKGFIVMKVMDKKRTGKGGFNFILLNGGMEMNARPLCYGSRHPFYVVSKSGALLSSEFDQNDYGYLAVPVGRCCESGDTLSMLKDGLAVPRHMAEPDIGDYFVVGGAGAYCSSMSLFNYNSYVQAPEILFTKDGELVQIRRRQTIEEMLIYEK
jgi:diaminopimelate decarboxylase